MLKNIKTLFVAAVMAMVIPLNASAFDLFNSNAKKQLDVIAKTEVLVILDNYETQTLVYDDFDRIAFNSKKSYDGASNLYFAAYQINVREVETGDMLYITIRLHAYELYNPQNKSGYSPLIHVDPGATVLIALHNESVAEIQSQKGL